MSTWWGKKWNNPTSTHLFSLTPEQQLSTHLMQAEVFLHNTDTRSFHAYTQMRMLQGSYKALLSVYSSNSKTARGGEEGRREAVTPLGFPSEHLTHTHPIPTRLPSLPRRLAGTFRKMLSHLNNDQSPGLCALLLRCPVRWEILIIYFHLPPWGHFFQSEIQVN